jgi:capsular exopolysaccharide synthesis family protein
MDLRTYLHAVRRRWWVVLTTVVVALGIGGFATVRAEPQYATTVTFFVTTPSQGVIDAYQGGLFLQQRVKSYVDLLTSDRLAQSIVADQQVGLTADEVRARISAVVESDTVLLQATVTDNDQARSLKLTESLAARFIELVQKIETPPGAKVPTVKMEVVGGPRLNPNPVSPNPTRNLALAGLLGLLLGIGASILRELIDITIRDGAVLQRVTSSAFLGEVPFDGDAKSSPLIVGDAGRSARAEALRKLRTNLRFVDVQEQARVIAVTSASQGEGKTTMCCNLAIAFAEAGSRVLLVDADLRRPKVAQYLGLETEVGLTDVLIGEVAVEDVMQPWGDKSLLVLAAGSVPPNPSELLGSKGMGELLVSVREWADIVIIDTAPLLSVTDGVVIAVQADGALLVSQHGRTSRAQAAAGAQALRAVAARLLGCVLNMAKTPKADAYYEAYRIAAPRQGTADRPGGDAEVRRAAHTAPGHAIGEGDGEGEAGAVPAASSDELTRTRR